MYINLVYYNNLPQILPIKKKDGIEALFYIWQLDILP